MPSLLFGYFASSPTMSSDSLQRLEGDLLRQVQPQRCWQASAGYDKFLWEKTEARAEVYYKLYDREYGFVAPFAQDYFTYNKDGVLTLREQTGKRRAYGVELSLGNQRDSVFFYSLGTSLFEVKNRYSDGTWYNDWTDVLYTFSVSLGARFLSDHALSVSVQGSGGRPFCPETVALDCIERKSAAYDTAAPYFSKRLANLVAANMRYSFRKRLRGIEIESFLEILNVLNYKPTLEYQFNGDRFIAVKPFSVTPIIGCTVTL